MAPLHARSALVLALAVATVATVTARHVGSIQASPASIPQVEVFKAGDKDNTGLQYNCFRIPALIVTGSGRVYAFAEGRRTECNDHGDVRIVVRVSDNGGQDWGPIMQVVSESGHTIGNPAPVVDRLSNPGDDVITLLYSRDNHQVFYTSAKDSDAGTKWAAPVNVTAAVKRNPSPTSWIATGPPGGVQMPATVGNGRLAICTNYKDVDGADVSFMVYSDDRGKTWNGSTAIPLGDASLNNECQMALGGAAPGTGGGYEMYAFIRGEHNPADDSHHFWSSSSDGGMTWQPSAVAAGITGPECEGSIGRYQAGDGSWRYLATAPASSAGRYNLTMYRTSGTTPATGWTPVVSLWSGPAAYSSQQVVKPHTTMGVLYERGQTSAYESLYLALVPVALVAP